MLTVTQESRRSQFQQWSWAKLPCTNMCTITALMEVTVDLFVNHCWHVSTDSEEPVELAMDMTPLPPRLNCLPLFVPDTHLLWPVSEPCVWSCCAGWARCSLPLLSSSAPMFSTLGETATAVQTPRAWGWMTTRRPLRRTQHVPHFQHRTTTAVRSLLSSFRTGAFCLSFMWKTSATLPMLRFTAATGESVLLTLFSLLSS